MPIFQAKRVRWVLHSHLYRWSPGRSLHHCFLIKLLKAIMQSHNHSLRNNYRHSFRRILSGYPRNNHLRHHWCSQCDEWSLKCPPWCRSLPDIREDKEESAEALLFRWHQPPHQDSSIAFLVRNLWMGCRRRQRDCRPAKCSPNRSCN